MQITRLRIENFRSIRDLDIELGSTTVFVGPNNAGKTAILDAVRIALTRRWGERGTGFTEYDIHLASETDNPKLSEGIVIELRVEEAEPGEWPDAVQQDLDEVVQFDPASGRNFISLRTTCAWSEADRCFQPGWTFLNAARAPLIGHSARRINLDRFWRYLPAFYLGALRDAQDEFSTRSQFWGRLLKAIEIPPNLEARAQRVLNALNGRLLQADPRFGQIAGTLSGTTRVAVRDQDGGVDLRLVPLKTWDLISKAEVVLRNESSRPWLPLQRHGQGVQSLSVIFLFQAFVEHVLSDLYEPDSSPLLALEEPETHLHPQAARTLWQRISTLRGQKLITTHSPHFVQHVPLRELRFVRLTENGTEVRWLPRSFLTRVPHCPELDDVISRSDRQIEYDIASERLTVHGQLEEACYRALLTCYGVHPNRAAIHADLRALRDRSQLFISDEELGRLETFAQRIRGEIFFAQRWMIVEGQAEYLIVNALSRELGYDLDQYGVAVIDAQNNGSAALFAALARALAIPWAAVFDGDPAGLSYVNAIKSRGFEAAFIAERCHTHPTGTLEEQLVTDGLSAELLSILRTLGLADSTELDGLTLQQRLADNKIRYASELARRLRGNNALALQMPRAFQACIGSLRGLT